MMIKEIVEREQKYVLTQPHETATSEVCVLKEVFVRNGSSAKIQCGAECNKVFVGRWRTILSLCHYGEHNWTIIQRRFDGSVNFRRNWREYEDGFGTFDSEFWIGDSFYYHNNAQFSTYDYDHDTSYSNCADRCKGGWWYTKCHLVNLNGEYANTNFLEGINWHAMTGFTYSLKEVRMMLRRP
uniref:Fibrinogen C-terminal domain-containing protein n=1 Tax=Magallana gigas TaxID=29159 RepID=A0A8W8M7C5_MAGGI